ncbi:MAG: hypothetical protein ACOYEW_06595 [Anaerolineae bacterium]
MNEGQDDERGGRRPGSGQSQLAPGLWIAIAATVVVLLVFLVFVLLQYLT